jgi:hypothetical protein
MKRYGLLLTTLGTMTLTGWVLHAAGWFAPPRAASAPRAGHARSADPLATPPGLRYRQGQPQRFSNQPYLLVNR